MYNLPTLNGNWVDLLLLAAALLYIWSGIKRGLVLSLIDLVSFIISFFLAINFYNLASWLLRANFNLPHGISNAAGFLLIGFLAEIILSVLGNQIIQLIPTHWLGSREEKLLGLIPAVGNALIISAFVLTLIVTLPVRGSIKSAIVLSKLGGPLVRNTQGIEKTLDTIFGGAIEESLTFLTINPESQETVDLNFTQSRFSIDVEAEREMWNLVNQERVKKGSPVLELANGKLRDAAIAHAKDMFKHGYFSHYTPEGKSPFDRMEEAGIKYTVAGENLALAPTVALAHQGLMNSPGHRENILSADFKRIGIGVIDGGIYGKMFVQEFTD